jgi:TetR/AcrR family transcriptional repressor of nem operon
MRVTTPPATRDRILDGTQRLIQAQGFTGFSYADVADIVGIRKASIHHHFPTKGDLALALMQRYRTQFAAALAAIHDEHPRALDRLARYAKLFANVLRDDHRLCMCGMLAADLEALPAAVRKEVRAFFEENEAWVAGVLARGVKLDELAVRGTPRAQARLVVAAFEGAMLVARAHRDVDHFTKVARDLIASFER